MVVAGLAAALIARYLVKSVIVLLYARPRPFVVLPDVHPLIATPLSENFQSFPSSHMVFFFALATVIFYFHKKGGVVALVAAALMGVARVFVGVHWPSDILAGASVGILVGALVCVYYSRFDIPLNRFIRRGFRAER